MPETIFEKIAKGSLPAHIVWENKSYMAFLDIEPLSVGHTLVVPKINLGDYIFDLDNDNYYELMRTIKEVAKFLKRKLESDRVLVMVEGFSVPHVHVHLIPTREGVGFNDLKHIHMSQEELAKVKEKIIG